VDSSNATNAKFSLITYLICNCKLVSRKQKSFFSGLWIYKDCNSIWKLTEAETKPLDEFKGFTGTKIPNNFLSF